PKAFEIESAPGLPVARERIAAGQLQNWAGAPADRDAIVDPERGRLRFLNGPPAPDILFRYFYGALGTIGAGAWPRQPMDATLALLPGGGPIAPGAIPPSGVVEIADNATYRPIADVAGITTLTVQAADDRRPYRGDAGPGW